MDHPPHDSFVWVPCALTVTFLVGGTRRNVLVLFAIEPCGPRRACFEEGEEDSDCVDPQEGRTTPPCGASGPARPQNRAGPTLIAYVRRRSAHSLSHSHFLRSGFVQLPSPDVLRSWASSRRRRPRCVPELEGAIAILPSVVLLQQALVIH